MQPKSNNYKNSASEYDEVMSSSSKLYASSVNSYTTASSDQKSNQCYICQKGFMFRRKYTCQVCLNIFCTDHCTRKRHLPGAEDMVSICDNCDIEETKKEINEEINIEISKFSEELKTIKETNEKLFREHYNKAALVNDLEMEIAKQEWNQKKLEQELLAQLEVDQNRGQKLRKLIDQLRYTLDELNASERYMSDQCTQAELELETLKVEVNSLQTSKEEVISQIEKISQSLRESLSIDQVRKILCQRCLIVVNESINNNKEKMGEDFIETIKEYHRESLISTEEPKKGCLIL